MAVGAKSTVSLRSIALATFLRIGRLNGNARGTPKGATVLLNVTGLPGLAMRFGTSKEGLPINVQIVGSWQAESTILHIASLQESVGQVRGINPSL